jgi:hypothetical protein
VWKQVNRGGEGGEVALFRLEMNIFKEKVPEKVTVVIFA